MNNLFDLFILPFVSLFIVVDPIGLIPPFLALTRSDTKEDRIRTVRLTSLTAFCVLVAFFIGGVWVLRAFGITVSAIEIAGGIIFMLIALDMLQARRTAVKETPEEQKEGMTKDDIAITPLAIPMLAGPGAIATVIILSSKATTFHQWGAFFLDISLVCLVTFVILRVVSAGSSFLSIIALKIITRLMGLLLLTISVQYILNGIRGFIG